MIYKQSADLTTSGTPGTVTPLVAASVLTFYAIVFTDAANTSDVVIGPTSLATLFPIKAGDWYVIQNPFFKEGPLDLKDWNVKSAGAGQTYRIAYL